MGEEQIDVAVIGAGGAGLLAGLGAARAGARTVLFERMPKPAKKVAISGGGRCNFSNTLNPREFVRAFGDPHIKRLGHALRAFGNDELIELLARHGVDGKLERHYRLYTQSGRGQDVVDALVAEYAAAGGVLETHAHVTTLHAVDGGFELNGTFSGKSATRHARTAVICTGGLSYPQTGSTGEGYAWARALAHPITELKAALVGLTLDEAWPKGLSGTAWPDAECRLFAPAEDGGGKKRKPLCTERKEFLFTHFGISGPAILDVSNAFVRSGLARARLWIDFYPERSRDDLDADVQAKLRAQPTAAVRKALGGLLPGRLLDALLPRWLEGRDVPAGQVDRKSRLRIVEDLKALVLTVTGTRGIEWGEVTAGGIDWEAIDERTMQSRHAPGLFFAGEILDLAGRCGGFNLQAAFSTGYLAGQQAARVARDGRPVDGAAI